jgi:nitrogen regulatory protein P-II 1
MKKLEIVIKPERLEALKAILEEVEATGVMISNVMGYGNQKGATALYRGTRYTVNLLPKIKVTTVTSNERAETIISRVCQQLSVGEVGDGKIFVTDMADVIRIRTGERGEKAL